MLSIPAEQLLREFTRPSFSGRLKGVEPGDKATEVPSLQTQDQLVTTSMCAIVTSIVQILYHVCKNGDRYSMALLQKGFLEYL